MRILERIHPTAKRLQHSVLALAMGAAVFFGTGASAQAAAITYNFSADAQGWTPHLFEGNIADMWGNWNGWNFIDEDASTGHLQNLWGAKNTALLRSPEFTLDDSGDLTFQLLGTAGPLASPVSNDEPPVPLRPSEIPVSAYVGPAAGMGGGFAGVALRDVAADAYVLSKAHPGSDFSVQPATLVAWSDLGFTAAELAPYANDGKTYTLDFVDYDKSPDGEGAWLIMRNVSIPGSIVRLPLVNDNFAAATDLTGAGTGQTGDAMTGTQTGTDNFGATLEAGEPDPGTGATNSVWFKWTCPADGNLTLSTKGSKDSVTGEWDAVLGIYAGTSVNALTALGATPQDTGLEETMTVAVSAGTTYSIQLAGYANAVAANILLNWTLVATIYQADMLSFGPGGAIGAVLANAATIAWAMPYGTNLAALAPTFTLSPGATCTVGGVPVHSGDPVDLSSPVDYTVTAQGASPMVNVYTVTVTLAPDESALIWNTTSGDWDFTTPNWLGETSNTIQPFSNALNVIFNSSAGGTITILPGMLPLSTTVSAGNYTFSGQPIAAGPLTKSGGGTLRLNVTPANFSSVAVQGGTLYLHAADNFAPGGASFNMNHVTVESGATLMGERANMVGSLTMNGGRYFENNGFAGSWTGPVYLAANSFFGQNGWCQNQTINGEISGPGGFMFSTTVGAVLTLSVSNSYSGPTAVASGTLKCNNLDALGSGDLSISNGAKVNLNYTGEHNVAALTLGGVAQTSGTYGSTASGASVQNDTFFAGTGMVRVPASSLKKMVSFSFGELGFATIGDTTISLEVPFGTDRTHLAPTYAVSIGATASPLPGTTRDFTSAQTYTVTAEDGSTQDYTVTITEAVLPNVFTWTSAASGNWSDPASWSNEESVVAAPLAGGRASYTLNFNPNSAMSGYTATNDLLSDGFQLNQLNLGGQMTLTLAGNALTFVDNAGTPPQINQNSPYWGVTVSAPLNLAANTTLAGTSNSPVALSGLISGAGSLTKNGTGNLRIDNVNNTFSGGTIINSGQLTMFVLANAALGSGPVTLNGGTLYLERVNASNDLIVNGGKIHADNGFGDSWGGPVALNANLTIENPGYATMTFNGSISGAGGMILNGPGPVRLQAANSYAGDTTVHGGTLVVNGTSIDDSGKLIITSGKVQATGTEAVSALFFGPNPEDQAAVGTWGATGSAAANIDDLHFTGTAGVVEVLGGSVGGYDSWSASNAGGEAANLDFDKDGVPNGIEYFMGISPSDPAFTPNPALVNGKVTWPHSAAATNLTYRVLTSENLITWSDVTPDAIDAAGTLEYTPPHSTAKLFVRLEVVTLP